MADRSSIKPKSFLELPSFYFDGARVLSFADGEGSLPRCVTVPPTQTAFVEASSHQDTGLHSTLNRWACNTCNSLEFASLDEQRSHFKSDFHRLNIKRKLVGREAISEEEFEVLAQGHHQRDDDVSSISGSEEEENESSDEARSRDADKLSHPSAAKSTCSNHISILLQSTTEIVTFWKCVVLRDNEKLCKHEVKSSFGGGVFVTEDALLQRLRRFTRREGPEEENLWILVLSRGGHFAGCVFDTKKGSILAHKTFHRYVVRAKAGGKQTTKDGMGRAPKSAGASLRRHNEASLQREIRELLASWKGHLEAASFIYVHAPSTNSHALFGGEDAPLSRSDARVCNVPITTRRPTFKEVKRIFNELMTITYQNVEPIDNVASSSKSSSRELEGVDADAGNKILPEVVGTVVGAASNCDSKWSKIFDTARSEIASADIKLQKASMPLHDAAKSGDVDLVIELLERGEDPCAKDDRGRTPYVLATDKQMRNAFRKFMASNLEMWDWHAANVPSALTHEMEAAQANKQAEKDAKRKAKAKEQKKTKKEKQKAREVAAAALNEKTVESFGEAKQDSSPSMSAQDVRKKAEAAEREKRALAAEKRIMALSNGLGTSSSAVGASKQDGHYCSFCGVSLEGMTPFYRFSYRYCTTVCVHAHRLALESGS